MTICGAMLSLFWLQSNCYMISGGGLGSKIWLHTISEYSLQNSKKTPHSQRNQWIGIARQ